MILNVFSKVLVRNLVKTVNSDAKIMSQRSILSFFKKQTISTTTVNVQDEKSSPVKNEVTVKKENTTSPVIKKKRKRINVGSESEEETISNSPEKKKLSIELPNGTSPVKKISETLTKVISTSPKKKNNETSPTKEVSQTPTKASSTTSPKTKSTTDGATLTNVSSTPDKKSTISTPKSTVKATPKNKSTKKATKAKKDTSSAKKTPAKTKLTNGKSSPKQDSENTKSKNEKDGAEKEKESKSKESSSCEKKNNVGNVFLINKNSTVTAANIEYFPDKKPYDPIDDAPWKYNERVPYLALAKTLQKIEETSARLKIIEILSNYLRSVIVLSRDDLLPSIYLCLNKLAPAYEGLELGIADMYLTKAIGQCTGRSPAQIKADIATSGDLGIVAEKSKSNQRIMFRPAPLTVQSVFNQLTAIAKISGQSAMTKKVDKIEALFVACRDCEARFIIRSLAGKMRIGLAEQSVLQALALACTKTPPTQEYPPEILNDGHGLPADDFKKKAGEDALILKTTFCECPNYNMIIPVLLKGGIKALPEECKITPGLPVQPMLAQPTKGAREVLERFEGLKFTCEWKYDGERAQIHLMEDGRIKIYSRNQEDNTSKYPDIIENLKELIKPEIKSFILDTEAVAWDREQKKIKPFQVLSTRKRKDADKSEIKVQVCVFMFDLLYLNGTSLTQKPLIERRNLLKENFQEVEGKFMYVISIDTNTMEEVQNFLEESVKGNCEGLMVKTLDTEATYEIAKRSRNWLKLKKDYLEGVGDTLDLVVIGGYTGKGKRTGTYGGFLLATYDTDNEEYQAICKIGTGFSDEMLATHTEFLKQHIIPEAKSYYRYDSSLAPDHWFDAVQVWEVKCADLSLSPIYHAAIGLVDPEKGISLRFPRFLKIRDDKIAEQATSSQQVADLYKNQDQIKNQTETSTFNEEDF